MVTLDNKLRNVGILVVDMLEQNILDHLVFTNYLMYLKSVFVWFSKSLKEYVLSWTIMNGLNVIGVSHIFKAIYKW